MPVHGIDDGNNKHAVYTAEEVLAILQQAIDSGSLQGIDPEKNPIVAAVRESHNNSNLTFWSGTEAEFNEMTGVTSELIGARIGSDGKLYLLTGDTTLSDTVEAARQAALEATEGMKREVISVTLLANAWSNTAPYTQTVAVAGMTADKDFLAPYVVPTGNESDDLAAQVALSCISGGTTDADSVTFYCYDEKPTTTITVFMVDKGTKIEPGDYPIASTSQIGMVKVGEGLNVDAQTGKLSVAAHEASGYFFDNVAAMAAYNLTAGDTAETLGYYSANDGGAAKYKIVDSGATADGGRLVALDNGLKAQLIIENGEVNIKQFGAKGDGVTDNTAAIQKAIIFAQNNNFKLVINEGEYIISQIVISSTLYAEGFGESSVIKSASNNTNDCIIKLLNDGMQDTILSNFVIDGNKTNNSNAVDGIKLINNLEGSNSEDRRTKIEDIFVKYCSGNGISTQGDMSTSDIREIRIRDCILRSNDEYGIKLSSCTDSIFNHITSFGNKKSGFHIEGGNHKITNCKAFANGYGDETTLESLRRIPASAFTQTSDATPVSGKTYYTRSGKNINGSWYIFTEFSGSAFDPDTDYYEMTTLYYKKYAGFEVYNSPVSVFSNCEAQDNYGDGFTLTTSYGNQLTNIITDGNGVINWTTSYADAGKEQLYYGIYMYNANRMNVNSYSRNFRGATLGQIQKAPVMCDNSSTIQGVIGSEGQVTNSVLVEDTTGTNLIDTVEIHNNGKPFVHSLRQEDVTLLEAGTSWWRFEAERFNETNHLNIIVDKTGGIITDNNEHILFNLPYAFRPNKTVFAEAMLSGNHGYNISGTCSLMIATNGNVSVRSNTTSTATSVIIRLDYTKLI